MSLRNWLDWLASSALFSANWSTPLCSPWSLASDASDCLLNFQEAHVSEHVMDLEQKGVARQRIKVLHLDVLMEQGSMALQRIAAFLGAGNETSTEPLPREGVTAVGHLEFFQDGAASGLGISTSACQFGLQISRGSAISTTFRWFWMVLAWFCHRSSAPYPGT